MGFEKGHEKIGGRKLGTRNKNAEMKDNMRNFALENFEDFKTAYKLLPPEDRCRVYLKVVDFVVPKVSAVKFEDEGAINSAAELLKAAAEYR